MQNIFSYNPNINYTAFMNWRIDDDYPIQNMLNMADGFIQSSLLLAKDSILDNSEKKADILIFAIMTNGNHGIELYLKAMVWTLNKLKKSENKIEGGHNLMQLLNTAQARILDLKGETFLAEFNLKNNHLIQYISELVLMINENNSKKDNMDFSRYPITKSYSNHFYVDMTKNVVVDLENFIYRFEIMHRILEEYTDLFYHNELMQDWE